MAQAWKYIAVLTGLIASGSHSVWAAEQSAVLDFDDEMEQSTAEVPIESIEQFVQIYGIVKDNYVQEKPDDFLFLQAIKGLVSGLDRYSRYLSPEDYKQLMQYTEADLATVDFKLVFDTHMHQWQISQLKENSDAAKQGLKEGFTVFKIDNQELKNLNAEQVEDLLHGSIGSSFQLQLNPKSPAITLLRNKKLEIADIEPVLLHNQVLVLKVKVFQQDTANEIKRLLEEYSAARIKAVLIDLRNNPGGLLSSAVETADLFLNQGTIVSTKSRSEGNQQFQALPGNEFTQLKMGILINNRSASAAEVFTAAMKDHQRAWVMGEKSYGKGVVQKLFPLPNGAALQMTVSHYFTPKDTKIDGLGITPNQEYPWHLEMKEDTYLNNVSELLLKHRD
ncbi:MULTISPECIES: S41 family peptidase [Acinetobacter]|uniref:S41 family peptidase n=1 Tax=Acinetobacter TaxID=469 RepID=UPI0010215EE2|nr:MULTISPECIES: S41 family peptidase [Acinetobacter]MDM1757957.1 S41 family peptidase [Acinetobacter sp. 256-1]MDM1761387.1 S41 family peptidase [Acinetobacter sp. 251-1]RYL25352.1 S41 family peptidase [Acinetobacter piscicola]